MRQGRRQGRAGCSTARQASLCHGLYSHEKTGARCSPCYFSGTSFIECVNPVASLFSYCHLSCVPYLFRTAMCRRGTPVFRTDTIAELHQSRMLNIYEFAAAGSCAAHRTPRCFGARCSPRKAQQAHPWSPPALTLSLAQPLATAEHHQQPQSTINTVDSTAPGMNACTPSVQPASKHPSLWHASAARAA